MASTYKWRRKEHGGFCTSLLDVNPEGDYTHATHAGFRERGKSIEMPSSAFDQRTSTSSPRRSPQYHRNDADLCRGIALEDSELAEVETLLSKWAAKLAVEDAVSGAEGNSGLDASLYEQTAISTMAKKTMAPESPVLGGSSCDFTRRGLSLGDYVSNTFESDQTVKRILNQWVSDIEIPIDVKKVTNHNLEFGIAFEAAAAKVRRKHERDREKRHERYMKAEREQRRREQERQKKRAQKRAEYHAAKASEAILKSRVPGSYVRQKPEIRVDKLKAQRQNQKKRITTKRADRCENEEKRDESHPKRNHAQPSDSVSGGASRSTKKNSGKTERLSPRLKNVVTVPNTDENPPESFRTKAPSQKEMKLSRNSPNSPRAERRPSKVTGSLDRVLQRRRVKEFVEKRRKRLLLLFFAPWKAMAMLNSIKIERMLSRRDARLLISMWQTMKSQLRAALRARVRLESHRAVVLEHAQKIQAEQFDRSRRLRKAFLGWRIAVQRFIGERAANTARDRNRAKMQRIIDAIKHRDKECAASGVETPISDHSSDHNKALESATADPLSSLTCADSVDSPKASALHAEVVVDVKSEPRIRVEKPQIEQPQIHSDSGQLQGTDTNRSNHRHLQSRVDSSQHADEDLHKQKCAMKHLEHSRPSPELYTSVQQESTSSDAKEIDREARSKSKLNSRYAVTKRKNKHEPFPVWGPLPTMQAKQQEDISTTTGKPNKLLSEMQKRAERREELKRARLLRQRQKELAEKERLAAAEKQALEREREQKRRDALLRKEKREQREAALRAAKAEKEAATAKRSAAVLHHKRAILRLYGFEPWMKMIHTQHMAIEQAAAHHQTRIMKTQFCKWKMLAAQRDEKRLKLSRAHFAKCLLTKIVRAWHDAAHVRRIQTTLARRVFGKSVTRKVFMAWREYTASQASKRIVFERRLRLVCESYMKRRLLLAWIEFGPIVQAENERATRVAAMHAKVAQWLPDYGASANPPVAQ